MRLPFPRRNGGDDGAVDLHARYNAAYAAGDAEAARALLDQFIAVVPDAAWAWFDLGLFHKRKRDWVAAELANERALEIHSEPGDPAAWNLGIAATALGHWEKARRAWSAYGVGLVEEAGIGTNDPIELDLGLVPIRLNPDPRHVGETPLLIDGVLHDTEVVWCVRLCPARARIINVPLVASGHRFGDIVLHDGEPVGERSYGNETRSVFNELQRLLTSAFDTRTIEIVATDDDADALEKLFLDRGWGAEEWASNVRLLCRACSENSPDSSAHTHPVEDQPAGRQLRTLAIAAPTVEGDALVDAWLASGPGREAGPLNPA